jgi:hypothetical protein
VLVFSSDFEVCESTATAARPFPLKYRQTKACLALFFGGSCLLRHIRNYAVAEFTALYLGGAFHQPMEP